MWGVYVSRHLCGCVYTLACMWSSEVDAECFSQALSNLLFWDFLTELGANQSRKTVWPVSTKYLTHLFLPGVEIIDTFYCTRPSVWVLGIWIKYACLCGSRFTASPGTGFVLIFFFSPLPSVVCVYIEQRKVWEGEVFLIWNSERMGFPSLSWINSRSLTSCSTKSSSPQLFH